MIGIILLTLVAAVLLELGKNTLLGWCLTLVAGVGFYLLRKKYLSDKKRMIRFGIWIAYLAVLVICFFISRPPVKEVPAVATRNPKVTDEITLAQGRLTGVYNEDESVEVYAGIPYAKAPVGDLRWKEPQDPDNWEGTLVADHFAPMSMQVTNDPIYDSLSQIIGFHDYKISLNDNWVPPVSEDSLYVNVWKPAGDVSDLPVLVYIHGGSLQTGQPWYGDYSGEGFAKTGRAVVVDMGYRLGVFGFYANEELAAESPNGTTGNYGLLDQIKALEWVQSNISEFGGDPTNVTLAGESAGSACVSALCTSPLAKGLFTKVVAESSSVTSSQPPHSFRTYKEALQTGEKLKDDFEASTLDDLRALSAEDIVSSMDDNHHITIDGYVLEKTPYEYYKEGSHNETALLNGYNKDESDAFMLFDKTDMDSYRERIIGQYGKETGEKILELYPAKDDKEAGQNLKKVMSADWFGYSHYCWTRQAKAQDEPVYEYYFTKSNGRLSAWHSGEEIYLYNNVPDKSRLFDESDYELENIFSSYVLNFMETGDPNGDDANGHQLPVWNLGDGSRVQELGENVSEIDEEYQKLYDIFDEHYGF